MNKNKTYIRRHADDQSMLELYSIDPRGVKILWVVVHEDILSYTKISQNDLDVQGSINITMESHYE